MSQDVKYCKHCQVDHPLTKEFWYRLEGSPRCKEKVNAKSKERLTNKRDEILAYQKKWREENREYRLAQHKKWREENAELHRENARKYHEANKEYCNARHREYSKKNREKINTKRRQRMQESPEFRLAQNLRVRLVMAIRRGRSASAVRDLGCSIEEFKAYLEAKFQPGMTWENYGSAWHIDHIRPLGNYDLSNREILLQLVHYTNLQPLWAADNQKKSNKE